MSILHRVVRADPGGVGWVVLDGSSWNVLTRARTKREAVEAATQELLHEPTGGRLQVHYADGRLESDRAINAPLRQNGGAPQASPLPPDLSETARVIAREGKHVDKGLDATDWVVTILGISGAPVGAFLNPELQEATGGGWIAFTLATFTWTVGCALGVVTYKKGGLTGFPLLLAVSLCFGAALAIAYYLGNGVLDITAPETGLGPFNFIATIGASAIAAYGPLGFVLSSGIGTWLGFRLSAHVDDDFLA